MLLKGSSYLFWPMCTSCTRITWMKTLGLPFEIFFISFSFFFKVAQCKPWFSGYILYTTVAVILRAASKYYTTRRETFCQVFIDWKRILFWYLSNSYLPNMEIETIYRRDKWHHQNEILGNVNNIARHLFQVYLQR